MFTPGLETGICVVVGMNKFPILINRHATTTMVDMFASGMGTARRHGEY